MLPTSGKHETQPPLRDQSCTWRNLAGQWLSVVDNPDLEIEFQLRRLAAVQRWRGLERAPANRP